MPMLTMVEVPDGLEELYAHNKARGRRIADAVADLGEARRLEGNADLLSLGARVRVFVEGNAYFKLYLGDRLLRMYSQHDFPPPPSAVGTDARLVSELAADVVLYDEDRLRAALAGDDALLADWLAYHETDQAILQSLCATYMQDDRQPDLRLRSFDSGETIVAEGDASTEVYWLIEGTAEVRHRDVTVGQVHASEFFGEIGFLLDQSRVASVTAVTPCMVQVVDTEEFVELIKVNPQVIVSLATNLASRIVDLNERVVSGEGHT